MMQKPTRLLQRGQALVEMALILIVLLMVIFVIMESARVLFSWVTVQSAVREGARFAITGNADLTTASCPPPEMPDLDCSNLRLASVMNTVHSNLLGVPLNEDPNRRFEDDYYYLIEVYGVDGSGQLLSNYAGAPGQPVVVRVIYRVPIVTPILNSIFSSIPVFGQVTMNNEVFGQLGNSNQGNPLPPAVPPVPTPGVTPSFTPSPTPSDTPSPAPSPTDTPTPTETPTPTCGVFIEENLIAGQTNIRISGPIGALVTVVDATAGATLTDSPVLLPDFPSGTHLCPGFAEFNVNAAFIVDHVIVANTTIGSPDSRIVLAGTATPTPTNTFTPAPTLTPSHTPTPSPTNTPTGPRIEAIPACGSFNTIIRLVGFNWPTSSSINIFWDNSQLITSIPAGHGGTFNFDWQMPFTPSNGFHSIDAYSGGTLEDSSPIEVPCPGVTVTPGASPTATPRPSDLVIAGPPVMLSLPPITEYEPVDFQVVITNTGDIDVPDQFFVDVYLDPTTILTDRIPLSQSSGYMAVSSLAAGASKTLIITADEGFTGGIGPNRTMYAMVDSLQTIVEVQEDNNISLPPLAVGGILPGTPPPTPPPPSGSDVITGTALILGNNGWVPQYRAVVSLRDSTGAVVQQTLSELDGFYIFSGVAPDVYTVEACFEVDGTETYVGLRVGIVPPEPYVDLFMLNDPVGCPPS